MSTEQKPEKARTKKAQTTPATNGKRKIKNDDVMEDDNKRKVNGIEASKKEKTKKVVKDNNNNNKMMMKEDDGLLYQIPMSRMIRIIKSEDPNVRIAQEAVYIINKASEKFLQVFTTEAYANAFLDRKKYIDYEHLSSVITKRRRFDFLSDYVPEKVKAEDALVELQAVED